MDFVRYIEEVLLKILYRKSEKFGYTRDNCKEKRWI